MIIDFLPPPRLNYSTSVSKWTRVVFSAVVATAASIFAIEPPAALAQVCATPGKDAVGSISGVMNTYYPGSGTTSGTTVSIGTIRPGSGEAIAAGDLVLIIQMQDGSTANVPNTSAPTGVGKYEYAKVASVNGSSLTLATALTHAYTQDLSSRQTFQVIRIPQYLSATFAGGVTALPWDGTSGGVVAIDVYGDLHFNSQSIDVTGKGFRGGGSRGVAADGSKEVAYWYQGTPVAIDRSVPTIFDGTYNGTQDFYPNKRLASFKGEGTAGTPRLVYDGITLQDNGVEGYPAGDLGRNAIGNAGGGGVVAGILNLPATIPGHDAGGGGGGNIGKGGLGGDTWEPVPGRWQNGGFGGMDIAAASTQIVMGGGGGAGITTNATKMANRPPADGVANGGPGGGIVFVRAGSIVGSGSISAQGLIGTKGDETDGGGGGGGGGAVMVSAKTGTFAGLTVNASGGNGSDSTYQQHGPGGGGGGGLVAYGGGATGVPNSVIAGGAAGFDAPIVSTITASHYGSKEGSPGGLLTGLNYAGCSKTNLLLVKRITAINNQPITGVVHSYPNDSDPNWPSATYLQGAIDGGVVKPGDEVEYTIYYLNTGNNSAKNVRICDRLHKSLIFQTQFDTANIATVGKGINFTPGNSIPQYLTNSAGDDRGFLSTISPLPENCNLAANPTDAASLSNNVLVVDVANGINYLPGAISPGNPPNSFGYIRFKAKLQ
jgi:uncharacterized repeat protein (TIGR01451 family)